MHPIFLSIGSFYIGTYGVMLALGLVAAVALAVWRANKVGIAGDHILDISFWCIIAGFVGGRITYIALDLISGRGEFLSNPIGMIFSREGFVFLGGLLTGVAMAVYLIRRKRLNGWLLADIILHSLALGHAFGRVGCFFAGCCYGKIVDPQGPFGFLAIRFPALSTMGKTTYPGLAFEDHLGRGLLEASAERSLPVWPTQLMESFGNLLIFALLFLVWRKKRFHGQVMVAYILLYGLLRFALEFLRGDAERGLFGWFSTSQWISLGGIAFALAIFPYLRKRQSLERLAVLAKQARAREKKASKK